MKTFRSVAFGSLVLLSSFSVMFAQNLMTTDSASAPASVQPAVPMVAGVPSYGPWEAPPGVVMPAPSYSAGGYGMGNGGPGSAMVSLPPFGMASRALTARLIII